MYVILFLIVSSNTFFSFIQSIDFPNAPGVKQCARFYSYTVKSADMDNYLWRPHSSSSSTKPLLYQATVTATIMQVYSDDWLRYAYSLCCRMVKSSSVLTK